MASIPEKSVLKFPHPYRVGCKVWDFVSHWDDVTLSQWVNCSIAIGEPFHSIFFILEKNESNMVSLYVYHI